MKALVFTLSMPHANSWNGRWSGEENLYAIIKPLGTSKKRLAKAEEVVSGGPYYHQFGDGWVARVDAGIFEGKDVREFRKRSRGFCGYDWMVNNIWWYGSTEKPETEVVA